MWTKPFPDILLLFVLGILVYISSRKVRYALGSTFLLAWIARVAGSLAFLWLELAGIYSMGGLNRYFPRGVDIAEAFLHFRLPENLPFSYGTTFLYYVSGFFYTFLPDSALAGFLLFATLGFVGSYLFLKSFRLAFPNGNHAFYGMLIFFYPSILFWASDLGKDSLIFLFLGLFMLGYVEWFRQRRSKWTSLYLAAGLFGTLLIRPHVFAMCALLIAATGISMFILPLFERGRQGLGFLLLALVALVSLGVTVVSLRLLRSELSISGILTYLSDWASATSYGGSAFIPPDITRFPGFLLAIPSVLFRPYPWEASNLPMLAASLEGITLSVLMSLQWRSLSTSLKDFRDPIVQFLWGFALLFIVIFNSLGNMGLLARQRSMLLPFLFMLLSMRGNSLADWLPAWLLDRFKIKPHTTNPNPLTSAES